MTTVLWLTQRSERHQRNAKLAAPQGLTVIMRQDAAMQEVDYHLAQAEVLVSERSGQIDASLLEQAPHLRFILRLGSLSYDIDLTTCQSMGIAVSCQPVLGSILVAEHLLMMCLALLKRLNQTQASALDAMPRPASRTDENTFHYNWHGFSDLQGLYGKTVAILGMGEIGAELARRLQAFQPATIYYNKRTPYPPAVEAALGIQYASQETCLTDADVVVNLLPYSSYTNLLLDEAAFRLMKSGSVFVHAGSGSTVHEYDLAKAIERGHLGGAALDTYEYEPLQPENPLIALGRNPAYNVILTPHVAGGSGGSDHHRAYEEIIRFLDGETLHYQIV